MEISDNHLDEYDSKENDWMVAIATDNAAKVDSILQNPPRPSTKGTLLHTPLPVVSPTDTANCISTARSPLLPFHFAVICHAIGVVKYMIQHGVDVTQIDTMGNNVIHTLINVSSQQKRKDRENIVAMYHLLITLISDHNTKLCLLQEDAVGLRPLELAASLGNFQLLSAIFHTPNVYIHKTEIYGFQLLQYFRVTEYEKFGDRYLGNRPLRDHVSPLRLLVQLDHHSIDMIQAKSTLLCEPLSTWVFVKMHLNKWSVIIQTLFTFVETACFFLVTRPRRVTSEVITVMSSVNRTNPIRNISASFCTSIPDQNLVSLTAIICFVVISLLLYFYGIFNGSAFLQIHKKFTFKNITNSGDGLVLDFTSSIMMASYCILRVLLSNDTHVAIMVLQSLYLLIMINTLRRLTRWCLPARFLRKYAMTMASITSHFVRVFHLVIFFSLVFGALLQHLRVLNTPQHLLDLPISYLDTLHKTFLLLLNIGNIANAQTNYVALLQTFHIIGHFTIVVLMFNFIIASMVNTYSHIRSNFGVHSAWYRLDSAFRFQDRTPPIIARLYTYFMKKAFVVENEEVYIVHMTNIDKTKL